MSQYSSSSSDLELLFIEKFQQKYKLNERDLKKAFSKFDSDKNNLLDIREIGIMARLMLNGVSDVQIRDLVARFDVNGDGKISYDEFLNYLLGNKEDSSAFKEANDVRAARRNRTGPNTSRKIVNTSVHPRNSGGRQVLENSTSSNYRGDGNKALHDTDKNNRNTEYDSNGQFQKLENNGRNRGEQYEDESEELQPDNRSSRYDNEYNDCDDQYDRGEQDGVDNNYEDNDVSEDYDQYDSNSAPYLKQFSRNSYNNNDNDSVISDAESNLDAEISSGEIECRCKVYLENLRIILDKKVTLMRDQGGLANHLTMSKSELLVHTGCQLLKKAFQPYTGSDSGRRDTKNEQLVDIGDFMRVLRTFKFPGFPPVRPEVLQYLFELCCQSISTNQTRNLDNMPPPQADTTILNDLIYGASAHDVRQQQLPRNNPPLVKGEQSGQRVKDTVSSL
jgi:hypothetical protein